jgi:hypothetical protein
LIQTALGDGDNDVVVTTTTPYVGDGDGSNVWRNLLARATSAARTEQPPCRVVERAPYRVCVG